YHDADHSSGSHVMEEDGAGAGAVENQGMETEQPSDPSHLGDAQGLMASTEKNNPRRKGFLFLQIQDVLLLLGGREMQTGVNPFPTSSTQNRVLYITTRSQLVFAQLHLLSSKN
ncbi:hypothetical protein BHE74_00045015, partial [Ensete ventricosum]